MIPVFTLLGASFTLVLLLMVVCWVIYLFQGRARLADVAWGIGFIIASWVYFALGTANLYKMIVITVMATVWAGRLTYHLYQRHGSTIAEDPRYVDLIKKWDSELVSFHFLMLFIFQATLIVVLSIPFLIVSVGSYSDWSQAEAWGILLWVLGMVIEVVADNQLAAFQKDPINHGKVYKKGLWRYSRHPNYFGEALIWLGYGVFALNSTGGWLAMTAPIIMMIFLLRITGIPITESHSAKVRGEEYVEYQRSTSAFFPWFPKK